MMYAHEAIKPIETVTVTVVDLNRVPLATLHNIPISFLPVTVIVTRDA